jgi:hypothetical protein
LSQLRHAQRRRKELDPVELELDAFLLDPGFGPPTYLTRDGRIVWDLGDFWDPIDPSPVNVYGAIAIGAKKTGVEALLDLLPKRPADAYDCPRCNGRGWSDGDGRLKDAKNQPFFVVCGACASHRDRGHPAVRRNRQRALMDFSCSNELKADQLLPEVVVNRIGLYKAHAAWRQMRRLASGPLPFRRAW